MAKIDLRGETNSIAIEDEIRESSQRREGMLEVDECEGGNSERGGGHMSGKDFSEEEYGSKNNQIDSDYDYQDSSIEQLAIPPPTSKAESDSNISFKGTCPRFPSSSILSQMRAIHPT